MTNGLIEELFETLDREKLKYDKATINKCVEYADRIYHRR